MRSLRGRARATGRAAAAARRNESSGLHKLISAVRGACRPLMQRVTYPRLHILGTREASDAYAHRRRKTPLAARVAQGNLSRNDLRRSLRGIRIRDALVLLPVRLRRLLPVPFAVLRRHAVRARPLRRDHGYREAADRPRRPRGDPVCVDRAHPRTAGGEGVESAETQRRGAGPRRRGDDGDRPERCGPAGRRSGPARTSGGPI